jgi:hypothetical protein
MGVKTNNIKIEIETPFELQFWLSEKIHLAKADLDLIGSKSSVA